MSDIINVNYEKSDVDNVIPIIKKETLDNISKVVKSKIKDSFPEPTFSENAIRVLERRYLRKDSEGNVIETPKEMLIRVARNIASAELLYDEKADTDAKTKEFYNLMATRDFMPNSPTLMNAGRNLQQLSACFVLPVNDSMESIFQAVKDTAMIHKSGGGTGFSFSRIRPKNDVVKTTKGISSGPLSFMEVFDTATETIKQGGTRRGANMAILNVDHPDIMDFITAKENNNKLNNFNISVGITDKFMKTLFKDEEYSLINPHTKKSAGKLKASEVFDKIVEMAWKNGEPGVVFLDSINKDNPTPKLGRIESTNPCGEQPLLPYEACNLGSINLSNMVKGTNGSSIIDYEKLEKVIYSSVNFLDNVIDKSKFPLKKIHQMVAGNRKIGLGIMGFADMLIKLGIAYNSEEAIKKVEEIMSFIDEKAKEASLKLAEKRGTFKNYKESKWDRMNLPLRNATVTTIAPTGTISIIAGCSSGIEPLFAISFIRYVMDKDELVEVNPVFESLAKEMDFYNERLMKKIAKAGTLKNIKEIPDKIKKVFVTAHEISPEWHIRIQGAFQKHTDNAVSKTINFPNKATTEDVRKTYLLAYKLGCKGVTVYRDGSREEQVLNIGSINKIDKMYGKILPRPRPDEVIGFTKKVKIGCGNLYITVNSDETGICEVFTNTGKAGGCASQSEATARVISVAIRSGIALNEIVDQLKGIRCPSCIRKKGVTTLSCPDSIARAIESVHKELEIKEVETISKPLCPECSSELETGEGCMVCRNCGYSKCE